MRYFTLGLLACSLLNCSFPRLMAQSAQIAPDVVYGHKLGLAMTMDVYSPAQQANGVGIVFMVSGGWYSNWTPPEKMLGRFQPLTEKGFTVFAVRHGSSPRFSIEEAVADVRRSVRFIRMNAERLNIDPQRIGVYGMSAGGHLSLMLGTTSDEGNPQAEDPVERVSNRVQAVVAYVAPTDLQIMATDAKDRLPAYDKFPALQIDQQAAEPISPIKFVSQDDAPTLLLAGAKDDLVPVFHSRNMHAAFEKAGVSNRLVEFENAGHGFAADDAKQATEAMVNWFLEHLVQSKPKDQ